MTAVSHVESTPRERRFGVFLAAEAGLWLCLYAVYFVIRGETIAGAQEAMANARSVVDIERAMGLAHERVVQNAIGTADFLGTFLAHYYELGFFPVVIAGLVYLARVDRVRYRDTRNIMLVAMGAAMVMFLLLPVAPPRLVPDLGIADTVGMDTHDTGTKYGVRYNPYAAMPSMHVGWTMLHRDRRLPDGAPPDHEGARGGLSRADDDRRHRDGQPLHPRRHRRRRGRARRPRRLALVRGAGQYPGGTGERPLQPPSATNV